MTVPEKYVQRKTMLDAGFAQVGCRACGEAVWWLWRLGDEADNCPAVVVCKNCGHISTLFTMELKAPMVTSPD